jgi:hypothetical protein
VRALELLLSNPLVWMRKRDLLIVAVLLLIALVAFLLFIRSLVTASRPRPPRDVPPAPGPPLQWPRDDHRAPDDHRPPDEVSKTRGVR